MSKGILKFDPINKTKKHDRQSSWKKIAMIMTYDDSSAYYRWFIEQQYKLIQGKDANLNWMNPPLRKTHVTIINDRIYDMDLWQKLIDKYDNTEMYFFFDIENGLRNNGKHIFYKVQCPMADEVREYGNLGDPYFGYHLTLGRVPEDVVFRKQHIENVQKYMINGK